jgi:hypothetical protein
MRSTSRYTVWFVNHSLRAGQVCVYHDLDNAACNQGGLRQLAWRVAPANPQVQVGFDWEPDWELLWSDATDAQARQFIKASMSQGSALLLSRNAYGCAFTALPDQATRGRLTVQSDASIPTVGTVRVGIGMNGGGALALPAGPNLSTVFTPVSERELTYWISFGAHGLRAGDPLDTELLNAPLRFCFPDRVTTMTALLDAQNVWTLLPGPPASGGWIESNGA